MSDNGKSDPESDVDMDQNDDVEDFDDIAEDNMVDLDEQIANVKQKIDEDKYDVDAKNELISLLRKNGDFEELETYRDEVSRQSLISMDNWLEWIEDARNGGASMEVIESLFDRALQDHNALPLWLNRIAVGATVSTECAKQKCEQALSAIGTRFDIGGHIWIMYIEIEKTAIQAAEGEDETNKGLQSLFDILRRALSVPFKDTPEILQLAQGACNALENTVELKKIEERYKETSKLMKEIQVFEDKLDSTKDSSEAFEEYLKFETEKGDPVRQQSMYERIAAAFPKDEIKWTYYGRWCEDKLRINSVTSSVYQRAIRHCPYSYVLYQQTLLSLERCGKSAEEIESLWNAAKENAISNADSGLALYRTYIYLLRRRVASSAGNDFSIVARIFEEGAEYLSYFGEWDPRAEYRTNQAYFYATVGRNTEKMRKVWEDILASGFGRIAQKWIEAANLERRYGDVEHARRLLYKALNSVADNPNDVYVYFIQFEREEGTLEQLDRALDKVNAQVLHRANRPQKKEPEKPIKLAKKTRKDTPSKRNVVAEKGAAWKKPKLDEIKEETSPNKKTVQNGHGNMDTSAPAEASSSLNTSASADVTSKLSNVTITPSDDGKWTVFVSNLDFKATEDDIKSVLNNVEEVRFGKRAGSNVHRGFAYVVLADEKSAKEALSKDRVELKGRPVYISENNPEKRVGFKYATGLEKAKLFVKNIDLSASEDQIKELFTQFGTVANVRLVRHKSGAPKGIAYVDFSTEEAASKALAEEKITFLDKELTVLLSDPPKRKGGLDIQTEASLLASSITRKGHAGMLQLVPRAARGVATPKPKPETSIDDPNLRRDENGKIQWKPMSNQAFRKFLNS